MDTNYGIIPDPDLPPVVHPAPVPAIVSSSESSLLHALAYELPILRPRAAPKRARTSPPPFYNPYPYPPQWRLMRVADDHEINFWRRRQDLWHQDVMGWQLYHIQCRVFGVVTSKIAKKQWEIKKQLEDARLAAQPPPDAGTVDQGTGVEFAMAEGKRGLPAKLLISTRRALERRMQDPKGKCFQDWPKETIWVRIKWPAYPDHEPSRSIFVALRAGGKRPRRPITRLELAVSLAGLLSQYYSEVSSLEPAPAFSHLALGPAEGRLSLYALRMMGIRLASDGVFDMMLELDHGDEEHDQPLLTQRVSIADMDNLISFNSPKQSAAEFVEGSSSASAAAGFT
ncbi:hypothetical protein BD414DRAFT_476932 [Trametes punicea]|nr:hypothetical protein BD414DRAFT_476932 [Trametes punicea]